MTESGTAPDDTSDRLVTLLQPVLAASIPGFDELLSAERLSGGASQETYRLTARIAGATRPLALRRAAGGETGAAEGRPGLAVEAMLMQVAAAAGVPEPTVHAVLDPDLGLGDGFVMEWLDGHTLGARIVRAPELDEIRPRLAYQCGQILARIHAIDPVTTGLAEHLTVMPTSEFITEMWNQYIEMGTPQPMIDFTARWLLDNCPETTEPRVVHNDFRNGNLMVSAVDGVTGVLDWEVCHLGDPMRDLGWICTNSWRFGRRDLPVGGFGHYNDLFAGYEAESGEPVDREHVHFWEVFGSFWWAIGCLKMADHWRHGPDPSVERPGIARRSSECQVDCVNLLIPGPVDLVVPGTDHARGSSIDMPSTGELVTSVRDFLRTEVMASTEGRTNFMARVAANSLDIVLRELDLTRAHLTAERTRLGALVGRGGNDGMPDLESQRWGLVKALRRDEIDRTRPDLHHHLRSTVVNQVAIDQPRYSGYLAAIATAEEMSP
ncbi:MAG: phosphotransferase family protein [Actinomycetota bacterium]